MPTAGMYTEKMSIYRTLLSKKIEKAVWWKSRWTPFLGMLDYDEFRKQNPYATNPARLIRPSGNVVDVAKDFANLGSIDLEIPIVYPLTQAGVSGTQPLRGREEQRKYATRKVHINQKRHAVVRQDNKMSKQMLKKPEVVAELMKKGSEDLADWFSRWISFQPYFALLTGYSEHLIGDSGIGNLAMKSHPNLYVQGFGKVDSSQFGTPTYENNVKTALASLTNTAGDYFGLQSIRNMTYLANAHRIQPLDFGGQKLYLIFISPAQALQLKLDSNYVEPMKFSWERGKDNPLFTGIVEGLILEQALLIVDNTLPYAKISGDAGFSTLYSTTGDTNGIMYYDPTKFLAEPIPSGVRCPAVLVGQGAVTGGYASEIEYSTMEDDYGQFIGDGADLIVGFERSDIYDVDGYFGQAGKFLENVSSLIYFTYSPTTLTI